MILLTSDSYFSPEQEFIENSIIFSQRRVVSLITPLHKFRLTLLQNGEVKLRLYRGNTWILGRWSATEKLYSEEESSMDSLTNFSPVDTSKFPLSE